MTHRDPPAGRTEAEAAFFGYLALKRAGSAPDFEAFCAEHPALAGELRQLQQSWSDVEPLLQSLLGANPALSLTEVLGRPGESPVESPSMLPTLPLHLEEGGLRDRGELERYLEQLGGWVGTAPRYRTEAEIGRGGMGVIRRVWDAALRRHLAMKVVVAGSAEAVPGADRAAVDEAALARFLDEALVTGQLDHPGIVPVHELGVDEAGQVYFTMKLVKGSNLRTIFDKVHGAEDGWTLNRAVGVILRVCEAVAYAHSKHVIHRDIKPANVMVGRYGETYLMDWGLARVLGGASAALADGADSVAEGPAVAEHAARERAADAGEDAAAGAAVPDSWLFTQDGRVLGTPVYMSPEQARGDVAHVDERSDIYSLGALLYHLLAGRMPYVEPGQTPLPFEVLMHVRRGPPLPVRQLAPAAPPTLLAICEKAMARALSDRFASAADMALALQDYLEDISEGREEARRQARRAQLINEFLTDMLVSGDPAEAQGRDVSVRDVLDRAAARIDSAAPEHGQDEAALRLTIGRLLRELGQYDRAEPHLLRAEALHRELLGDEHAETLSARTELALLHLRRGRLEAAGALLRATLGIQQRTLGAEHRDTLRTLDLLASVLQRGNVHSQEAEALRRQAHERRERALGADHPDTLASLNELARLLQERGRPEDALPLHRHAHAALLELHGERHPLTLIALNDLAGALLRAGRAAEAEPRYREALAGNRRVLGAEHPHTLTAMNNLGSLLHRRGSLEEAEDLLAAALAGQRASLGPDHPNSLGYANNLALLLLDRGRAAEAEALLRDTVARAERTFTAEHAHTARFRHGLGRCLARLGRTAEARAACVAACEVLRRVVGTEHAWWIEAQRELETLDAEVAEGKARRRR